MPPPPNQTALTATSLGALPADVTQDVHDAGTTYTVWYKFTAPANVTVVGAWGFGGLGTYIPTSEPYSGPAAAPVPIPDAPFFQINGVNRPIQFRVTAGQEYFLRFVTNGGNPTPASLRVRVESSPNEAIEGGDILVMNANDEHPAVVYDSSGTSFSNVRKFLNTFPVSDLGSQACLLTNGLMLVNNDEDLTLRLMSSPTTQILSTSYGASGTGASIAIRSNRTLNRIYFTKDWNPVDIQYFDQTGTLSSSTETLTAINNARGICANNDATILYHSATAFNAAVRRWNLVTHAAMSDLVAGQGANTLTQDILILTTGDILVAYGDGINGVGFVKRYDSTGAVLATYNLIMNAGCATPRIAYDNVDDTHFWAWSHYIFDSTISMSRFVKIRVSDGVVITQFDGAQFQLGELIYPATATPVSRFGNHNCCPFMVMVAPPMGGIYFIDASNEHDTYYGDVENKIPNPTFKTALIGE